jgi:HEAT repeat protein
MGWFANRKVTKILELRAQQALTEQAAEQALRAVGEGGVDALLLGVAHPSRDARLAAIKVLGGLRDARAVGPLIGALADEDGTVVEWAATALGELKAPEAAAALVEVIQSRPEQLKACAAEAVVAVGAAAVQPLIDALAKDDAEGRPQLVVALGRLGDASAIPTLVRRLWDKRRDVRSAAAVALRAVGWTASKPEDQAWYDMAGENWHHCISLGAAALAPLCQALDDEDYHVRIAVLVALRDKEFPADPASVRRLGDTVMLAMRQEGSRTAQYAASIGENGVRMHMKAVVEKLTRGK